MHNSEHGLTDGEVAALAREVVDEHNPSMDISITPTGNDDPYRRDTAAWLVRAGDASARVTAAMTRDEALETLRANLTG